MELAIEPDLASLARQASAGDAASLEQLLADLRPLVVRVARLIVGPGSWVAEDAAQDALIDISRNIGSLREPAAIRAWALRVAVTRATRMARRERLRPLSLHGSDVPELATTDQRDQYRGDLKRAFYSLPPKMRAVAILRLYIGLSEAETADSLGTSIGTVKSQLHEARKRLIAHLGDREQKERRL